MDNPEKLATFGTQDEENKAKAQHNMCWTSLYINKHKMCWTSLYVNKAQYVLDITIRKQSTICVGHHYT
jgi:hypothetical protein